MKQWPVSPQRFRQHIGSFLAFVLAAVPGTAAAAEALSAKEIVERAHGAAGGELWVRPESLYLVGNATFFSGTESEHYDRHEMWRVYAGEKTAAHEASGKVRIRSAHGDNAQSDIAFDGERTYINGEVSDEPGDSRRWASNFGFGVIRHALEPGYALERLPDDSVDGAPSYMVRVIDPAGGRTVFGMEKNTFHILMVGFDTPRGWHHRVYSEFFTQPDSPWLQPGLVRLFYNGIKQNEVRWTSFAVNEAIADSLFSPSSASNRAR